jgi:hypothetical protein
MKQISYKPFNKQLREFPPRERGAESERANDLHPLGATLGLEMGILEEKPQDLKEWPVKSLFVSFSVPSETGDLKAWSFQPQHFLT